jgi:hypothetical protein
MRSPAKRAAPAATGGWWAEAKPILALVVLAVGLRAWQLTHTEVAARDTLEYVHTAWRLEHEPWPQVLRSCFQHPGYPLTVLAAAGPARAVLPYDLPGAMQLAAQAASALASVLLVVPVFLLGRELFDRRVCFWAGLLLQCLPSTGRLMGDGLSEPLFLLLAATALLGAARGLRTGAAVWFAVAGLFGGLAYLTRPEGLLLVAAAGLVLLALTLLGRWRGGGRHFLLCGAAMTAALLAVALPYMLTIGGLTVKPSARDVAGLPKIEAAAETALPLATWKPGWQPGAHGGWNWAVPAVGAALAHGFFFVLWLPALLGLVWHRGLFGRSPAAWLLLLTAAAVVTAVGKVAEHLAYVSDRHLALVLLAGFYWAAAGLVLLGDGLAARLQRWRPANVRPEAAGWLLGGLVPLLACAVPLVKTLEVLHEDRLGFRQAGAWLAENANPDDVIVDPFRWAEYYAGRTLREPRDGGQTGLRPSAYVVVEESANGHSHLPEAAEALQLAQKGQLVKSWQAPRGRVAVYEVPASSLPPHSPGP